LNKAERAAYQRDYRKRSKQTVNKPVNEGVNVNSDVNSLREANRALQAEVISLRAEVARLKQLLAARPIAPIVREIKLPKGGFVSDFSAAAQAKGVMVNNSPLARMARGEA